MVSNGCSWGILLFEIMGCVHISRLSPSLESRKLVGGGREQERVGAPTGRTWHGREEEEEGVFQKTWTTLSEEREHHGGRGGGEGGRPMRKGRDSWSVLLQSRV